jgi:hypothetical protein
MRFSMLFRLSSLTATGLFSFTALHGKIAENSSLPTGLWIFPSHHSSSYLQLLSGKKAAPPFVGSAAFLSSCRSL